MFLNIIFIIALTFPVAIASTAFNIVDNEQLTINNVQLTMNNVQCWSRKLMVALILALGQGVMYFLGSLLGGTFMHLMERLASWIVLALCFSVAFRMLLDTLKIRNGENLYFLHNKKQSILLSIALGVNAFIVGLMSDFLPLFHNVTPFVLIGAGFIWSLISMLIPFSKMKLTLNSFLNSIFAAIILVRGILSLDIIF